jgi:uncharacterized protein (TIGR03083 family)
MSLGSLPYLEHLSLDSARFRTVLADAPEGAPVPTCPGWDADDLLAHLSDVQWFWGEIAERRITAAADLAALEAARPRRPDNRAGLLALFDRVSDRLHHVLSQTPPETELWMWADDHSAAYITRRQTHEALVHRIDAELTAGVERSPVDCRLAADGVDEALRVMRGFTPEPGLVADPMGGPVTISVVDGMHTWTVTPVHVTGTDADGDPWDAHRLVVTDGSAASVAQICGTAADLDCWLWNRPSHDAIASTGDEQALAAVRSALSAPVD